MGEAHHTAVAGEGGHWRGCSTESGFPGVWAMVRVGSDYSEVGVC